MLHGDPQVRHYLADIIRDRQLIVDLQPGNMVDRNSRTVELQVPIGCYPVVPPKVDAPDALFRMLQKETASGTDCTLPEEVRAFWTQANKELKTLQPIQAEGVEPMLPIDDDTNDGIVNTNRQVLRRSGALANTVQCRRLVVGDHLDVAGHFGPLGHDAGLLRSGAGFGDPQFKALYRDVAQFIAKVMANAP
ncbi:MAG: hypothetical protein WCI05_17190 [Myxococcales bacterium]